MLKFLSLDIPPDTSIGQLQKAIASLIQSANHSDFHGQSFDNSSFMTSLTPQFQGSTQQDIGDFKIHLFETIEEISPGVTKDMRLDCQDMLTCQICHQIRCSQKKSEDLFLSIPDDLQISGQPIKLQELFELHTCSQVVRGVRCPKCLKSTDHRQQSVFLNSPSCIVVHLKLFNNKMEKILTNVTWDDHGVSVIINGESKRYHVIAQAQHIGQSIHSGHYISQFKSLSSQESGDWIEMDDHKMRLLPNPPYTAGSLLWLKQGSSTCTYPPELVHRAKAFSLLPLFKRWDVDSLNAFCRYCNDFCVRGGQPC